eukprot:6184619-Pleurochrysis_carterae.AAC.3
MTHSRLAQSVHSFSSKHEDIHTLSRARKGWLERERVLEHHRTRSRARAATRGSTHLHTQARR